MSAPMRRSIRRSPHRPTGRSAHRPTGCTSRRPARVVVGLALALGLGLVASACSGSGHGGELLLARDTSTSESAGSGGPQTVATDIWAVTPGEQPSRSNRLAESVSSPLYINSVADDGTVARDLLGTQWGGQVLSAFVTGGTTGHATVGDPGAEPTTIASAERQVQASVVRRGVYVATADGCRLARSTDDITDVGSGLCQMSEDERWVVSWPAEGGELTIRDLRSGDVRRVEGTTTGAVVLGHGTSVLAVQTDGDGSRGVVIDATTGKVTGRTDRYDDLQVMAVEPDSTGFVALASSGEQAAVVADRQLLWVGTDARTQVIDRGLLVLPVQSTSTVTYLRFGNQEAGSDSIRRWDSGTGARTTLLSGAVGLAAVGPDELIATRDTDTAVEVFRSNSLGELEQVAEVPGSATGGSSVGRVLTLGSTSYLDLSVGAETSLVRVDLHGDHSDVPVQGWAQLLLEGVDGDGTVLVSGRRTVESTSESIGVVAPNGDGFEERATAGATGLNLIHEGTIYLTTRDGEDGDLTVRTVRSSGETDGETLYTGYQLAGATWPTDNGATQSTLRSRAALIAQQQSQ
ncbi:MAG: hypothetical protein U0P47_15105 [Acidimicrobiales bacterium]